MDFNTSYPLSFNQKLLIGATEEDNLQQQSYVSVSFANRNQAVFVLSADQLRNFSNRLLSYPIKRDHYCIIAIKNLFKKNDFLQLSLQRAENLLSDEEFEKEIEENPHKYTIDLHEIEDGTEVNILSEIAQKVGREFTQDEVCELFSFAPNCLNFHQSSK